MYISDINTVFYYYNDHTTKKVVLPGNRITRERLLFLCSCNDGIDHVTVITHGNRKINLGIQKAKSLFKDGQISDF